MTFTCLEDGFTLTSDEPLVCELNGGNAVWNRELPQCVGAYTFLQITG